MLDKIFGWGKNKITAVQEPPIPFGRYSDNNKPLSKIDRWTEAGNLFKERKFAESIASFFEYLKDDAEHNVVYRQNGHQASFEIYQGSKIVRGVIDDQQLKAEVTLARMPQASIPVMRRLLEMNFSLYYSRFALDQDRLCMRFDSSLDASSPNRLYFGLKELATRADKQDDLLIQDFASLECSDNDHVHSLSDKEKEVKFEYLQRWLKQTLDAVSSLDAEKMSGGIAFMLLSLVFRIDYLLTPEGRLLHHLELIVGIYFKKDERPVTEKNRDMIEELKKLQGWAREDVVKCLFRSKYTFSVVAPQQYKAVSESVHTSLQSMGWYRDNNYPFIATQVAEYGISFCQYSYSLPKAITELFNVFMEVNYSNYYRALGFTARGYDETRDIFDEGVIIGKIKTIQSKWKEKHPLLDFKTQNLRFDSLVIFNQTFCTELEFLNVDIK